MGRLFQWWDLPNEGVFSIAVKSFVIFPHVYSLGVHFYLLIPELNTNLITPTDRPLGGGGAGVAAAPP